MQITLAERMTLSQSSSYRSLTRVAKYAKDILMIAGHALKHRGANTSNL